MERQQVSVGVIVGDGETRHVWRGSRSGQVSVGVIVGDGETRHVWRGSRSGQCWSDCG